MAPFNPDVKAGKAGIPNWSDYKPISNIEADKSTGMAYQALGNAIEGAATLADTTVKDVIKKDVRDTIEPIREQFTSELQYARDLQQNNVIPTAGSTDKPIPAAINAGLNKVDAVQQALVNGKINDTYYDQRLKSAVTDLRAKYPGYVDYIDQRVSQITGFDPANALVQNLMQDINRAQSSKKTEYDKVLDIARKAVGELPNAEQQYNRLKNDPSYQDQFMGWYSAANAGRLAIEADNRARSNRKMRREDAVVDDTEKYTNLVSTSIKTNFDSAVTIAGVDTPGGITKFIEAAAANPDKYSGAVFEKLATQILAQKTIMQNQLRAVSNETKDGVPSYAQSIGTKTRDEILNSQLAVYDDIYNALKNKDAGLAFYHMNQSRARLDDTKNNILSGPAGKDIATFKVLQDTMGPQWTSIVINEGLRKNIDEKIRPLFNQSSTEARAQPDFTTTGKPVTYKEHEENAIRLQKEGKITQQMRARYTNNLINIVDDINDPRAPQAAKENVVRYLFSPEGQGILKNIKVDYTDPETGKFVPGKYSVWQRLSSPDVVQNISKLPNEYRQMYKNYMEREAGSELFFKELQDLNRFTGHDDLHFKYNDGSKGGTPSIELIDKTGKPVQTRPRIPGQWNMNAPSEDKPYLDQVNQTVGRINDALSGMHRVESGFGGNASDYLLSFLIRSQVDLGKNWEGLPKALADAIAASRVSRKLEDTFKKKKGE